MNLVPASFYFLILLCVSKCTQYNTNSEFVLNAHLPNIYKIYKKNNTKNIFTHKHFDPTL